MVNQRRRSSFLSIVTEILYIRPIYGKLGLLSVGQPAVFGVIGLLYCSLIAVSTGMITGAFGGLEAKKLWPLPLSDFHNCSTRASTAGRDHS